MAGNTPHPTHREARPSRSRRAALVGCAVLIALQVQVATAPVASAAPEILLGQPRVGEFQPVRGDDFLAWQQNTRANPDDYDVFARPIEGGGRFQVNPARMNGANGDIDGDVLVYQQFKGSRRSQVRFFDLVSRDHDNTPAGVNTKQWEYWPSMSGRWLLFGRLYQSGMRRIILFDLTEGTARRLDQTRGTNSFLAPGQVSGDYAVWHRCSSNTSCNVIRYHIPDATKTQIPNPGGRQYSSSVTPDGTVYFARSSGACGEGVRLMRNPLDGDSVLITRIQSGDDVGSSNTYVDGQGITTLLYDQFDCARPAISDAWQMIEDTSPTLTVTKEGDASGTVASSPAGINCGSDCTESYDQGTGVTLTATPAAGATFAGWGGACTGTTTTCTLTMNGPRSVTATFTNKPVLTVTKPNTNTGTGTVTSSPPGINCGGDCNEPYNEGTTVSLTAQADSNSTFAGWGGACSGMGSCMVMMTTDRTVTATFTSKPLLTVSPPTNGTVTGNPGDIDCPGDCSDAFDLGTDVTLTADPDSGFAFDQWGGACSGSNPTCVVDMDSSKSVTATFVARYNLDVTIGPGDGTGTVTSSPGNINCPGVCTDTYDDGTTVTLTASPGSVTTLVLWSGDCTSTTLTTCSVDMDGNRSVTATFDEV